MKTIMNISNKDLKEGFAHMARMAKRPQVQVPFQSIDEKVVNDMLDLEEHELVLVISEMFDYANKDNANPRSGACKLQMYYNDTFDNAGKTWYEDVYCDYYKAAFQCDYGTLHFYWTIDGYLNLDFIEASKKGKGYGTKLMNYFLDACEAVGIADRVITYPCYIQEAESFKEMRKGTAKLRSWMREFGFTDELNTARMYYVVEA